MFHKVIYMSAYPVADILQSNRRYECVDETSSPRGPLHDEHAFRTHIIRHDFRRVNGLHRSERKSENDSEYYQIVNDIAPQEEGISPRLLTEDERYASLRCRQRSSIDVVCRCTCRDSKADRHASSAPKEHLSTSEPIMEAGSSCCRDPSSQSVNDVKKNLGTWVGNANLVHKER